MDVDGACLAVKVEAPGFLQNLLAAEDESAVFGECEQQVEFLGAQIEGRAEIRTSRRAGSMVRSPRWIGAASSVFTERSPRRKMALTRATNSRGLKGLVR